MVGVDGRLVYESLVLPDNQVADYNTRFSGITKKDLGERWNSVHNERFGNIVILAKGNVVDLGTFPSNPPLIQTMPERMRFFLSFEKMKTILSAIVCHCMCGLILSSKLSY